MRHAFITTLAIILLVTLVLGALFWIKGRYLPPSAQTELEQYLAYRYPLTPEPAVRQLSQATRPWLFKAAMSGDTYGRSTHFDTTFSYARTAARPARAVSTEQPEADWRFAFRGAAPLPYPPEETWCLRLDPEPPNPASVVLLAMHVDLYNGEWVVHEMPGEWSETERRAALSELGCALDLTQAR